MKKLRTTLYIRQCQPQRTNTDAKAVTADILSVIGNPMATVLT
ncbi:MAG: hypothetical protein U1C46_06275 [Bacteroidales bacterium]|nr:hypothetical protein [Bacteroidales bacterium]